MVIGYCSVLVRQTNIIWIGYLTMTTIIREYGTLTSTWENRYNIIRDYIGELLLLVSFIVFLVVNEGIVVGDSSHHQPVLHLSQVLYLLIVSALYLPIKLERSRLLIPLFPILSLASIFILQYFSYTHPFLLSDNTHYTFYIWKDIISQYPIFIALLSSVSISYLLPFLSTLQGVNWLLCSGLALIPAQLLEPRYFCIPLSLLCLDSAREPSRLRLLLLKCLNITTVLIFSLRPYKGAAFLW